ncbi:hypothetical protein [Rhodococcus aetherivorans]|uniref:hypothetical protein n=1 Tax=Rhodococcus aetherivorans TaxID=191292 RepID=UPI001269346F|nr:hypothetical protein [Rhodococcus aetherivorans]NGP28472.1 hypothetical protein [Rhodococcus aetherivorans]
MADVLVRFTADLTLRCTGDEVLLSAAEVEAVDKEAKFLGIEHPYEVVEEVVEEAAEPAQEETDTEPAVEAVEAPTEEPVVEEVVEEAAEPAQEETDTEPAVEAVEAPTEEPVVEEVVEEPQVETKSKSKKGAKK